MEDYGFSRSEMNEIFDGVFGSPLRKADFCQKCGGRPKFNSAMYKWPNTSYWLFCPKCTGYEIKVKMELMSYNRYGAVQKWNSYCAGDMRKHYQGQFC